jgi:hypothetical protein
MAKRKFEKHEIKSALTSFVGATYQEHGSHSFAAGYLESLIASILVDMPRHKQVEVLTQLYDHARKVCVEKTRIDVMA